MKIEYEAHRPYDLEVHMEYGSLGSGRTFDYPNTENEDKSGDAESSQ